MQTRIPLCFPSRLLYYNSKNYVRQLHEGGGYEELRPAINISFLDRILISEEFAQENQKRWQQEFYK